LVLGYFGGYLLLNLFNLIVDWLAALTAYPGNAYLIVSKISDQFSVIFSGQI